jgi:pantoate--beta-alanine ligase
METFSTIKQMRSASREARRRGLRMGLVPTMGALHAGHLSLVRAAKAQADIVAVSIFVNPTQFGPTEDLAKYPRPFETDRVQLEQEGVDILFAPTVDEMYRPGATTYVTVEGMSDRLCGKSRPGHFRGVTTVVSKMFNIAEPDMAFFGQKDAAQLAIIRRMVHDLDLPVKIMGCPIIREPDGLAMSSRNAYLTPPQRQAALILHHTLREMKSAFNRGERRPAELIDVGKHCFQEEPSARLDYLQVVDPDSLEAVDEIAAPALVAIAGYIGTTRLIDNQMLKP